MKIYTLLHNTLTAYNHDNKCECLKYKQYCHIIKCNI